MCNSILQAATGILASCGELHHAMFDRDTELASNSAVSFNNEDEAEELALARLEAELRALEVEEEALAREEVEGGMWVTEVCTTSRAKMRLRSRVKMRCPLMKSGRYLQPCNIPGGSNVAISTEFIVQVFDFVFLGIGRLLVLAALSVTPPRAQKI